MYRWRIKPESTEQFRDAWRRGTIGIQEQYGSCGSRLHRLADGTWAAYAVWPSEEVREEAFSSGATRLHPAVGEMLTFVEEILDEISMTVTDDLLVGSESKSKVGG